MQPDDLKRFEEVYNRCFPGVNRYLRYRVESTWDADDLTAAVFIRAFEKFHQCRAEGSCTAWVFRIAHNVFVDYLTRSRRPELATEYQLKSLQDTRRGPEEQLLLNEEIKDLRLLLEWLPKDYRDVVALRYAGELKFSQIGEVLGKTEAAARTVHHRALKLLRAKYDNEQCRKEGGAL
ncbi:MAG: sigma-70 family RNA polymerase sigma factor [Bacillota bacterium]